MCLHTPAHTHCQTEVTIAVATSRLSAVMKCKCGKGADEAATKEAFVTHFKAVFDGKTVGE